MACGIPLVCSPWEDTENLFTEGKDYLIAHDKNDMIQKLYNILNDVELSNGLSIHAMGTILANHTCAHRVDQLENICKELGLNTDIIEPKIQQL
jgi:spore maturation protein CgeB